MPARGLKADLVLTHGQWNKSQGAKRAAAVPRASLMLGVRGRVSPNPNPYPKPNPDHNSNPTLSLTLTLT